MPFRHVCEAAKLYVDKTKPFSIPKRFRACAVACIAVFARIKPSPNESHIDKWLDRTPLRQIVFLCRPASIGAPCVWLWDHFQLPKYVGRAVNPVGDRFAFVRNGSRPGRLAVERHHETSVMRVVYENTLLETEGLAPSPAL